MNSKEKSVKSSKSITKQKEAVIASKVVMFTIISFIGFLIETVYCSINEGKLVDRGFLTLPLCGLYGTAVLFLDVILGNPIDNRFLTYLKNKKIPKWLGIILSIFSYVVLSAIIATTIELVVGVFFDKVANTKLWDYSAISYNLDGYICLPFSIIWGFLCTFIMAAVFYPIEKQVVKIKEKPLIIIGTVMVAVIAVDLAFNFIYLSVTGSHFDVVYYLNTIKNALSGYFSF